MTEQHEKTDKELRIEEQAHRSRSADITALRRRYVSELTIGDVLDAIESMDQEQQQRWCGLLKAGEIDGVAPSIHLAIQTVAKKWAEHEAGPLSDYIENLKSREVE